MFTLKATNSFLARMLAGLMIAVTVVVGSLAYAVSNTQVYF